MAKNTELEPVIESIVTGLGYILWGTVYAQSGRRRPLLRVYIEHEPAGVTLADCQQVSRQIKAALAVEDGSIDYDLEVSSPGIERPLFKKAHFERVVGKKISVTLHVPSNGQRNFKGTLKAVAAHSITIVTEQDEFTFLDESISKANVVASLWEKH